MTSASNNTIGGDYFTQQNVISGNLNNGVEIDFRSNSNYVQGNLIGLSATGTALGNGGDGVHVLDASNNNILGGGSGYDANGDFVSYGNSISANTGNGIRIDHTQPYPGPSGTQILGNYLGLGTNGATPLGNGQNGVLITDSPNTVIGDGAATDGNIISGNGANGLGVVSTTGTKIYGNDIGTDVTGLLAKPNQGYGVQISSGSTLTQVGQAGASFRNIISGNIWYGIDIAGAQTTIANNYIGVGSDGQTKVGNQMGGIEVENTATQNTIGGANYNLGNVISGNQGTGPTQGSGITLLNGSNNTTIAANMIGTNAAGLVAVGNSNDGIYVQLTSTQNTIGWNNTYNIVSGNGNCGIEVNGTNNTINFNMVGLSINFTALANGTGWWVDNSNGKTNTWGPNNFHN